MFPPILITCFARKNVSGSFAAATATVVKGPTAIMVIVPGGLVRKRSSIISCDGSVLGLKSKVSSLGLRLAHVASDEN
jgi:hypothetical protein